MSDWHSRYYARNRARIKARNAAWNKRNREAMRAAYKRWAVAHPEKVRANKRATYARSALFKPEFRITQALRRRIQKVVHGKGKSDITKSLLGCSESFLLEHLENQFQPGMSWDNYGSWHVDHIRPCASFDLTNPDQQRACFHYTNLQPLWAADNVKKGASLCW